jgi:YD repeat-containing protein
VQERYDVTYTYDEVGNRLTKVEGRYPTTYSYDGANQLGTETYRRDTTTYSYDANGNTQVINAAGALTTNTWDIENHLTVVQLPAGTRTTATYDGDGKRRRYEDNQDALLRNFLWDGENIARQTDVNNATNRRYTLDPQVYGELISQDGPAFHHYDALGSTDRLTDAGESSVVSYLYRAFGEETALFGSNLHAAGSWPYWALPGGWSLCHLEEAESSVGASEDGAEGDPGLTRLPPLELG